MVLRRSWGRLALGLLLLGAAGCGGGPGTFELVLDPAAITIPPGTLDSAGAVAPGIGDIDVLIRCGTNKNLFVIVLALAGVPDDVQMLLPPGSQGSSVNCESGDPPPAILRIEVGLQAPGVYPVSLRARNFARSDFSLTEPITERIATLTLTVQQ